MCIKIRNKDPSLVKPKRFKTLRKVCNKVCSKIDKFYTKHEKKIDTGYIVIMTGLSIANIVVEPWTAIIFGPLMLLILHDYRKKYFKKDNLKKK